MKWSDPNWKAETRKALEEMSLQPEEVIRACARVREELDTEENRARLLSLLMESGLPGGPRPAGGGLERAGAGEPEKADGTGVWPGLGAGVLPGL